MAFLSKDVPRILELYLVQDATAARKASVEWALIRLLANLTRPLPDFSAESWPMERLASPSGAVLYFVLTQNLSPSASMPCVLPRGLSIQPCLPSRYKQLVAQAWLNQPAWPRFDDSDQCRSFANWLGEHRPNLGVCLLIAALRGDDLPLVEQLGTLWLEQGLAHPGAPEQVLQASGVPILAEVAHLALDRCIALFYESTAELLRLLTAGVNLGATGAILALSEALLGRELGESARQRTLAARLAALADGRRHHDLADEFRLLWLPTGWRYPWPERLLYRFQELGDEELEHRLLTELEVTSDTPHWVLLTRETAGNGPPQACHLEAWGALYKQNPRDERFLVGVTRVVLRCPNPVKRDWAELLGIRRRWEQLTVYDGYRELADAYLVLLHTEDEDRILEFEARFGRVPGSTPAARRATRAYLASLRRTKQWNRLHALETENSSILHVCPFEEREQLRLMARLAELPVAERAAERDWCAAWESLISLPMTESQMLEMLELFVNLTQQLELRGGLQHELGLLNDVRLQVLRRSKAAAEIVLARNRAGAVDADRWRSQLVRASVEATYHLFGELRVAMDPED